MKSTLAAAAVLACGLALGLLFGGGVFEKRVEAQPPPPQAPRFQISAWGMGYPQPGNVPGANGGRGERGCYIIDTVTGELWHAPADGKPAKISEPLR
jgi:hypothetical protein